MRGKCGRGEGSFRFTVSRDACPGAGRYFAARIHVNNMAERDIHVVLVLEIEKYPALYNYNLTEYSRKDVTERIWSEISNKTHLSVHDCKEKWRNIRSTFLRSFKTPPSGSKPKKPYYLKDYLSFILPYVKPNNEAKNRGNIPPIEGNDPEAEEQQIIGNEEPRATAASNDIIEGNTESQDSTVEEAAAILGNSQVSRRRRYNAVDSTMIKYLNTKIEKAGLPKVATTNQTKMNHFFLSLLSEFDDMTDNQIRSFKIKVLQVIDEIKQGYRQTTPTTFTQSLPST
ncbi:unnamed protein product [Callosobruchus maculatus]|uniref:MADF domain-containing protein n=1 Tax=Callosobruchus maculatus TaxID=64391 RepID=A0A653DID0_CALMS|nr:unnamed protein product [Callosobruchus maculatus]